MAELWIALKDLPAEGREFSFTDQSLWTDRFQDFGLVCHPGRGVSATALVQPQGRGCLVTGSIEGSILVPCDRCAEEFEQTFAEEFTLFETLPGEGEEPDEECRIREEGGHFALDAAAVLWEQFVLALPVKPLCSENCRGLCPRCGANLNEESCACQEEGGDPRLAVLRGLKLSEPDDE